LPLQRPLTQTWRKPAVAGEQEASVVHVVAVSQVKTPSPAQTFWLAWAGSVRLPQVQPLKHGVPTPVQVRPQSPLAQMAPPGQRPLPQTPQNSRSLRTSLQAPTLVQQVKPAGQPPQHWFWGMQPP
jgi:hypothetical protein